jgi:hypothetical protein
MSLLSFSLYLGGGLSGIAACSMFALSYSWKARLYRTQWDYRFTAVVFILIAVAAICAGWFGSDP